MYTDNCSSRIIPRSGIINPTLQILNPIRRKLNRQKPHNTQHNHKSQQKHTQHPNQATLARSIFVDYAACSPGGKADDAVVAEHVVDQPEKGEGIARDL